MGKGGPPAYNTNNHYTLGGTSYDGNGNLTADTFNTYAWDSDANTVGFNLGGSAPINVTYDAFDRIVEENNSGTYKQILYSPIGKLALMARQVTNNVFLPLPGGEQATYTGNTIRFRHYDWLGSARFESNMAEAEYGDVAYAPFGETYSIRNTPYLAFTGQQQGTVSGTYDFLYRKYNPVQGRWISPDPAGLTAVSSANPQSWNRYAYVSDNPLIYGDPLGLDCVYIDNDTGAQTGFSPGDCDNSTVESANSGYYFDGTVDQNSIGVDSNGDVSAQVNGSSNFTCSGDCSGFTLQSQSNSGSDTIPSWTGTFLGSFFSGFTLDFGPGSCLGVAVSAMKPAANAVGSAAKNIRQYAPGLIQSAPGTASIVSGGLNTMANYAQQMRAPTEDVAMFTTAAAALNVAASQVSAWGATALAKLPTGLLATGDVVLGYGVYKEAQAALSGKCH